MLSPANPGLLQRGRTTEREQPTRARSGRQIGNTRSLGTDAPGSWANECAPPGGRNRVRSVVSGLIVGVAGGTVESEATRGPKRRNVCEAARAGAAIETVGMRSSRYFADNAVCQKAGRLRNKAILRKRTGDRREGWNAARRAPPSPASFEGACASVSLDTQNHCTSRGGRSAGRRGMTCTPSNPPNSGSRCPRSGYSSYARTAAGQTSVRSG
jgi:hypothetical protein